MRIPIIAGNWKMNKTPYEAAQLVKAIRAITLDPEVEAVLCVPSIDLSIVQDAIGDAAIGLGAENMYYKDSGAYTGEISPRMLTDLGVEYVILGHSERREYFHEGDRLINNKVLAAFAHDLKPILCVGETLEEREAGQAFNKVKGQLEVDLLNVPVEKLDRLVIAYEPIWAIGTGKTASAGDAEEMCAFIRAEVAKAFGAARAEKVRIQYGGSVKPNNVAEIMEKPNIDGALVGGASLEAESFAALVNYRK